MIILGRTRRLRRTARRVQLTPKPLEPAFLYPMALVRCASLSPSLLLQEGSNQRGGNTIYGLGYNRGRSGIGGDDKAHL